jgi:hypothetical protein
VKQSILPAAVFCLNVSLAGFSSCSCPPVSHGCLTHTNTHICLQQFTQVPRKLVFDVSDDWFPSAGDEFRAAWALFWPIVFNSSLPIRFFEFLGRLILGGLPLVARLLWATTVGLINLITWMAVVFATAAPMTLSGLYEATVDRQALHAIEREVQEFRKDQNSTTNDPSRVRYQVHLLYALLVGNLELYRTKQLHRGGDDPPVGGDDMTPAWTDVHDLVRQINFTESPEETERQKIDTAMQLNAMLSCQASFGATIGAPVAFFLGSFLFSIFSNLSALGDNDTSHALAFGEWWTTVPHIAIVAGCLLAGNNPNTLEAIVSGRRSAYPSSGQPVSGGGNGQEESGNNGDEDEKNGSATGASEQTSKTGGVQVSTTGQSPDPDAITPTNSAVPQREVGGEKTEMTWSAAAARMLGGSWESVYEPVWMWERGRSKRNWFDAVQMLDEYKAARSVVAGGRIAALTAATTTTTRSSNDRSPLRRKGSSFSASEFTNLYKTSRTQVALRDVPQLGLLSWTALILTASVLLVAPWFLAYVTSYYTPTVGLSCRTFTYVLYFVFQACLAAVWFYDFPSAREQAMLGRSGWPRPFFWLVGFFFAGSVFTTIAGTLMQIVGIYRNCKCTIPISAWAWAGSGGPNDYSFIVSTNSADQVYYASLYWLGTGVASIAMLIIFCYLGWWYQRHWRARFRKVVGLVLSDNRAGTESMDVRRYHDQNREGAAPLPEQQQPPPVNASEGQQEPSTSVQPRAASAPTAISNESKAADVGPGNTKQLSAPAAAAAAAAPAPSADVRGSKVVSER